MDIKYKPVSVIQLQKITQSINDKYNPVIPQYSVTLPNGAVQKYDYDSVSIKDEKTPVEDVEKWEAYQNTLIKISQESNEKTVAYLAFAGVDCEVDTKWIEMQEWLGLSIPKSAFDAKVAYVTTELWKTPYDIKEGCFTIMKLSTKGVDKSAVKAAEETFRNSQD